MAFLEKDKNEFTWRKIDWPTFEVLIGGKSSIDLDSLSLKNAEEIKKFLRTYGHDPANKEDQRIAHAMLIEAIRFIEHKLIPREWKRGKIPPSEILKCQSPVELIKFVSLGERDEKSKWACAILKIMHTISHMRQVSDTVDIDEVRQQIMGRFQTLLKRDSQDQLWLKGKHQKVKLDKVEWKVIKDRDSILLKLLHKPGNVAETIYDIFGVRVIVENHAEAIKLLNFLVTESIISFPNSYPSRSRNTLIDLDSLRQRMSELYENYSDGKIDGDEFIARANDINVPAMIRGSDNPHSSKSYRSIQMTCRQLVTYPDPKFTWLKKVRDALESGQLKDKKLEAVTKNFANLIRNWRGCFEEDVHIFFPYEIQIFDRTAAKIAFVGEASHSRYKQGQVRTARRRILSEVLVK